MHQGAVILRAMPQVDHPFMEPDALEGARGHLRNGGQDIRPAERAKTMLREGANVRIAGIEGRINAQQNERRSKVRLMQFVHVRVSSQGAGRRGGSGTYYQTPGWRLEPGRFESA